jgi:Skp family chaperone for outer membrane proteins
LSASSSRSVPPSDDDLSLRDSCAALGALLALSGLGTLAQELKIGYVNSERVMRESNLAKAAQGQAGSRVRAP